MSSATACSLHRGSENLLFNYAMGEAQELGGFLGAWHRARITYDMTTYTGSVWIDNQPIVSGVPLKADLDVRSEPEVSLSSSTVAVKLWIDDLDIRFVDLSRLGQDQPEVVFRPLFRDNFERYGRALFPEQGGWHVGPGQAAGGEKGLRETSEESGRMQQKDSAEAGEARSGIDDRVYASSSASLKLEGTQEEPGSVFKRFSVPERIPFSVSAENFAIVASGTGVPGEREGGAISERESRRDGRRQKRWESDAPDRKPGRPADKRRSGLPRSGPDSVRRKGNAQPGSEKMMSGALPNGTYYIYSFDGRLLAEYDVSGFWIRDYIYFGGQLVAEYRAATPQNQYYFYASDQISSTRIVTDSTGAVVYSAAHEAYGGIQKTWVTNFDPELKFSGKPRDTESELDYFGARYYDRAQYRFISVDPIIAGKGAVSNLQRWNLYGYCLGNPLAYVDPTGEDPFKITIYREGIENNTCYGSLFIPNQQTAFGRTLENADAMIKAGTYKGALVDRGGIDYVIVLMAPRMTDVTGKPYWASIMPGGFTSAHNCIMLYSDKFISEELMRLLAATIEAYAQEGARALLRLGAAQERELYAEGLDMIFAGWDGLESLSSYIRSWERLAIEVEVTIKDVQ